MSVKTHSRLVARTASPVRPRGKAAGLGGRSAAFSALAVKKLVNFRRGKIESVLLPILVTSAAFVPKIKKEEELEAVHPEPKDVDVACGSDSDSDYHDYAASSEEEADDFVERKRDVRPVGYGDQAKQVAGKGQTDTTRFISTLMHAMECRDCSETSCKKMRLVLGHFLCCEKNRQGLACQLCAQLLRILSAHAQTCSLAEGACAVPMCDALRRGQGNASVGAGNVASREEVFI